MMKIYEKYILYETLKSYIFFFFLFNFLFIILKLIDFTDKIIDNSIPLASAIKLSILLTPSFAIFTIPLISLSSVLFTYSNLSSTNELVALKTFGISSIKLIKVPIIIGLFSFILGMLNNVYCLPFTTKTFFNEVNYILKNQTAKSLKEKTFNSILDTTMLYCNYINRKNNVLKDVFLYEKMDNNFQIIVAKYGEIDVVNNIIQLKLTNGKIHIKKSGSEYEIVTFKNYNLKLDIENNIANKINLKDKESSINEIKKRIKFYEKINAYKKINYLKMEIYKRYSLPFASIIFVIIGVIFGMKSSRNPKSWTFFIIFAVVFLYYSLVMLTSFLVKNSIIIPFLGAWLPNLLLGIVSIYLLYLFNREKIKL